MKLPSKITPDRIRESIVQVFFTTNIPIEPLVGYLYSALGEVGYKYTNRPLKKFSNTQELNNEPSINEITIVPQYFFFNEEIKIQLHETGTLVFNCVNEYIGWKSYFSKISEVLSILKERNIIHSFSRVGIRYISEFPNIDILDKIAFSFKLEVLQDKISTGNFRLEWQENPYKIVTNIASKLSIPSLIETENKVDYVSLIDIDVILKEIDIEDISDFLKKIDEVHLKQKTLFFSILKGEFIETLNPEYN